jgi:predicted ArsR family transcriptional regulator
MDRVLEALRTAGRPMSRTDISAALGRHVASRAIERALQSLRAMGRVRCRSVPTAGRPAEVWEIVP